MLTQEQETVNAAWLYISEETEVEIEATAQEYMDHAAQ